MTDKQIIRLNEKALHLNISLSNALQELAKAVSDRLGKEVVADLCNGGEIEFRHVLSDGVSDDFDCIRLSDILTTKEKSKSNHQ